MTPGSPLHPATPRSKRPRIMGVLNVTPDSFSDGGHFSSTDKAVARALQMLDEGADIIDVGGESTRPSTFRDATPLDPAVEIARIVPVIKGIIDQSPRAVISVDTYKSVVAEAALDVGAGMLNDVSGLSYDIRIAGLAARYQVPLILMHMPGRPRNLPINPVYDDLIGDISRFLKARIDLAHSAGVEDEQIIIDPGIGFGKDAQQNMEIIRRLPELKALGYRLLVGPSRKSFLGKLLDGSPPEDRLEGTAAACILCVAGGADILRVHDVRFIARMTKVYDALLHASASDGLSA